MLYSVVVHEFGQAREKKCPGQQPVDCGVWGRRRHKMQAIGRIESTQKSMVDRPLARTRQAKT